MVCLGGEDGENYDGVLKLLDVLLSPTTSEAKNGMFWNMTLTFP